jgi:glycosyltransferase involved in cell wall biosynthesis
LSNKIKISVALCTYNGEVYLEQQLTSILSQTIPVDEIIVCDDCSSDSTCEIIQTFINTHPGVITLTRNQQNIGARKNFEKAISLTTGDVIFLSDQDDLWNSNKVEEVMNFFSKNPKYYGLFTDAEIIDDKNKVGNKTLWETLLFDELLLREDTLNLLKCQLLYRNFATGACMALKREAFKYILPFNLPPRMWHDEWIALKLAEQDKLGYLHKRLVKYRVHNDQQTGLTSENYNPRLLEVRRAIFRGENTYPLFNYFHWKKVEGNMSLLKNYLSIPVEYIDMVKLKKRQNIVSYFKSFPFVERKIKILKWRLKKKEDISFYDLVVL